MLQLPAGVKIYYCRTPINLHRSFDGLPGAVQQYLQMDPLCGQLFVFFNRTFKMLKILYWDDDGYAIWSKRLVRGMHHLPKDQDEKITLDIRELHAVFDGVKTMRYYQRFSLKKS